MATNDVICCVLYLFACISHRNTKASPNNHREIISVITRRADSFCWNSP
jgi:hypothetical protein